jgi:hypothetical protein
MEVDHMAYLHGWVGAGEIRLGRPVGSPLIGSVGFGSTGLGKNPSYGVIPRPPGNNWLVAWGYLNQNDDNQLW